MIELMDKYGVEGYGRYFILMELCAKQLEKDPTESINEAHCRFSFSLTKVRQRLRIGLTKMRSWLDDCQTMALLSYEISDSKLNLYVPKLLEFMDSDFKRSRQRRGKAAQNTILEEEEEEIEEDKDTYKNTERAQTATLSSESKPVSEPELSSLIGEWGKTLQHFKISKDPRFDEVAIVQLMRRHGSEKVRLALVGQRFESKTETYDPAKHLSIMRISRKPEIFEKLVNLGAQDQSATTAKPKRDYSFLEEA